MFDAPTGRWLGSGWPSARDRTLGEPHENAPQEGGAYHVRIDAFEGPFDLLLQLIARRELDVSEVDLAEITGDFLANLSLEGLDLDTATHFLVVAATLVELKAARLLPTTEDGDLEGLLAEARDVLYARLLEYRAFRDVCDAFAERLDRHGDHFGRQVPLEDHLEGLVPDTELEVGPTGLAALAAVALAPRPEQRVSVDHIHHPSLTVREAASRVLQRLAGAGARTTFAALVAGLGRADRVVHLLALLELYKLGRVELDQPVRFGTLSVRRRPGADSDRDDLVAEADAVVPSS